MHGAMLGRSHSLREDRRRPSERLPRPQRFSMVAPRHQENVPPMTRQAATCACPATFGPEPLQPLQSRDPNRWRNASQKLSTRYPAMADQAPWQPPPPLQRSATYHRAPAWGGASWKRSAPGMASVARPLGTGMQPSASHDLDPSAKVSHTQAPKIPATGGATAVFRSASLRAYFQPPEPLVRQPSLAAGRTRTDVTPMTYTLVGDDLEAVLKKGLEAVKRRQTSGSELGTPNEAFSSGRRARGPGESSLPRLASWSYAHAMPACQSVNAERRPDVRHAHHHYAPHMFESQRAEIYVMR